MTGSPSRGSTCGFFFFITTHIFLTKTVMGGKSYPSLVVPPSPPPPQPADNQPTVSKELVPQQTCAPSSESLSELNFMAMSLLLCCGDLAFAGR